MFHKSTYPLCVFINLSKAINNVDPKSSGRSFHTMDNKIKSGLGLLIISLIGNSFIGYNVNSNRTFLDMVCAVLQGTILYSLDILA